VRIALLNQFFAPDLSPTAHLAASLARHRAEAGDEVTVVTGRSGYVAGVDDALARVHDHDGHGGVRVIRLWTPGGGKATIATRLAGYVAFHLGALWRMLTLPPQDVIVSLTTPPYVVVAALAHRLRNRRARVVLWSMDCYPDAAERFGQLRPDGAVARGLRRLNRAILPRLAHVVCLDGAMLELLGSRYGRPGRPPMSVIPNWEPAALFPPPGDDEPPPWPGWAAAGVDDRFRLVYLGNAGYGHRFDTVAAAARRLDPDRHALVFVGGGVRWGELERARRESAAAGGAPMALLGYVPKEDTPRVLAGAGAALIVLDDDALGVMSPSKLHAALARGVPVVYVGPEGSNVDEAIRAHGCGVSLRHGDVDGLVAALDRLATDPAWRAERSAAARRAFDEDFADTRALPRWDAVIDGVGSG
jgi:glycosyltransferase involved in cell wall biosynthesis